MLLVDPVGKLTVVSWIVVPLVFAIWCWVLKVQVPTSEAVLFLHPVIINTQSASISVDILSLFFMCFLLGC